MPPATAANLLVREKSLLCQAFEKDEKKLLHNFVQQRITRHCGTPPIPYYYSNLHNTTHQPAYQVPLPPAPKPSVNTELACIIKGASQLSFSVLRQTRDGVKRLSYVHTKSDRLINLGRMSPRWIKLTIFSGAFRGSLFWDLWVITLVIKPVLLTILLIIRSLFTILAFFIIALDICTNIHI